MDVVGTILWHLDDYKPIYMEIESDYSFNDFWSNLLNQLCMTFN
jgi:hypothetical protein